jgi:hypothetical protein
MIFRVFFCRSPGEGRLPAGTLLKFRQGKVQPSRLHLMKIAWFFLFIFFPIFSRGKLHHLFQLGYG